MIPGSPQSSSMGSSASWSHALLLLPISKDVTRQRLAVLGGISKTLAFVLSSGHSFPLYSLLAVFFEEIWEENSSITGPGGEFAHGCGAVD